VSTDTVSQLELGHHDSPAHCTGHHTRENAPRTRFKSSSNKTDFLPARQKKENFARMVAGFYPLSSISDNSPLLMYEDSHEVRQATTDQAEPQR